MPTAGMPLVDGIDSGPTQIWWRFWFALLTRTLQTVQATVNATVTATGTNQLTAAQLESEWNVITAGSGTTGVVLDGFNIGVSTTIINESGSNKLIYPPPGMAIDALGTNNPYTLANTKQQTFSQVSATQFFSTQLG